MARQKTYTQHYGGTTSSTDNSSSWDIVHTQTEHSDDARTPDEKVWWFLSGVVSGDDVSNNTYQHRMINGSVVSDSTSRMEPRRNDTSSGRQYVISRVITSGNPENNELKMQFRTSTAALGIQARVARVMGFWGITLNDLVENTDYMFSETSTDLTSVVSGSWTSGQSVTIPSDGEDWLIVTSATVDMPNEAATIRHDIYDGTTAYMELANEQEDTNDVFCVGSIMALESPSKDDVIEGRYRSDAGSTLKPTVQYNNIFAIRLGVFEDHAIIHDTSNTSITVIDTDTVVQTLSYTPSHVNSRDKWWLTMAQAQVDIGDDAKKIRSKLTHAGTAFTTGTTRMTYGNGATDLLSVQQMGIIRAAHNVDLDIDLVLQEDVDVAPNPVCTESVIVAFIPELKVDQGVRRITEWEGTYLNEGMLSKSSSTQRIPVETPTTGPTGNVTIASGSNRLFVFNFALEHTITDVSAFTIGGVSPTGSFKPDHGTGGTVQHAFFWWWDEAAIQSMSGLAISWTDDQTWVAKDAYHSWATFTGVDQSDPVPASDQNEAGASSAATVSANCGHTVGEDICVGLFAINLATTYVDGMEGFQDIYQVSDGAVAVALFEAKEGPQSTKANFRGGDTVIVQMAIIRIKAGAIGFPYHIFQKARRDDMEVLLTM